MLLGLDVGGTFTDAVIIDGHRVVASAKRRTTKDNLMQGIGEALDAILQHCDTTNIDQVTLSTTVVCSNGTWPKCGRYIPCESYLSSRLY
nr:hydantoinase/oxoprolinase N-terminal domain-containing protein [Veillonella sp.]